jgi:hypothetical protein
VQNVAKTTLYNQLRLIYGYGTQPKQSLRQPQRDLFKATSVSDDYINIEIADVVKAYLINPTNAPNTSQPTLSTTN